MNKLLLITFTLFICGCYNPQVTTITAASTSRDSLKHVSQQLDTINKMVSAIKLDKLFEIKDVFFDKTNGILNIAFTNKDNVIKERDYSILYFENTYHQSRIDLIDGIALYAYKKHKHLANHDYADPLVSSSKKMDAYREKKLYEFKDKFCTSIDCTALEMYIKKNMNDPDSYDPVNVDVKMTNDGDISVIQEFRGKNSFNATITERAIATLSSDGTVLNFKLF